MNEPDGIGRRLIIALDKETLAEAKALLAMLPAHHCRVKIGKGLFTAAGPAVVEACHEAGFTVFLDLKYHDIPNTVAAACRAAAGLGVWMVNVHASGGRRMLGAARDALAAHPAAPLLTAVTVLTSATQEDLDSCGVSRSIDEQVLALTGLALDAGLDGVVCSAREAGLLRNRYGDAPLLVTPGIRPAGVSADDQRRVVTPQAALGLGVSHIVVGRPVTASADPARALEQLRLQMAE